MGQGLLDIYYDGLDRFTNWKRKKSDEKYLTNKEDLLDPASTVASGKASDYYAKQQKLIDDNVQTIGVGTGGQINVDIRKTGKDKGAMIGEPHLGSGYSEIPDKASGTSTAEEYSKGFPIKKEQLNDDDGKSIAKISGFNWEDIKKQWKDKGGMDALMSNPAFTLGLALMQSSAKGKNIGEGILDNFVKAADISSEFKDRLKAKGEIFEATSEQISSIKATLGTMGTSAPNWLEALVKPGNQNAQYEAAVEKIAIHMQKKLKAMRKKYPGRSIDFDDDFRRKVIKELIDSKKIRSKGGFLWFFDKTLETTDPSLTELPPNRAEGGPVEAGQAYVVGEKGPEVIIPHSDGNVVANDDTQIFAMLLASNPQLQNVSKQRAENILRSRFPEYFQG